MRPVESFVGQPVRSLQTMLRVLSKRNPAIPTVIPDGIYGPATMNAVAAFQRSNNLPGTGTTDQRTWDLIAQAYDRAIIEVDQAESIEILLDPNVEFQQGDSGPYIYLLQSMLIQLSNDHASIDPPAHTGVIDNATTVALTQFQQLAGLNKTGRLDKRTWKHLVRQFTLNAHHNMRIERQNSANNKL